MQEGVFPPLPKNILPCHPNYFAMPSPKNVCHLTSKILSLNPKKILGVRAKYYTLPPKIHLPPYPSKYTTLPPYQKKFPTPKKFATLSKKFGTPPPNYFYHPTPNILPCHPLQKIATPNSKRR